MNVRLNESELRLLREAAVEAREAPSAIMRRAGLDLARVLISQEDGE